MDRPRRAVVPGDERLAESFVDAGFRGELTPDCPLAPFTTWRIGGPATLVAHPADRDDLVLAVRLAHEHGIPWRVMGNGSNLLVRDEGVRAVVLRMRRTLSDVRADGDRMTAEAGAALPSIVNRACSLGLSGLEFGAGIPGTVGGAIVMNAGWHEMEIGNLVDGVEFLEGSGLVRRFDRDRCGFRYRGSTFRDRAGVVLAAEFRLTSDDPAEIRSRMDTYADSRRNHQPTEFPSCGSVFLQPPGDFAGRLIDRAGLKGLRVGDLQVSPKHANFFVNLGHGTCADALALVERVEREVLRRFGVQLRREFDLW